MYYILIVDGKAQESIPEFNPKFPGFSVEERYAPAFLAKCVQSESEICPGWVYDADTGDFSEPLEPNPEPQPEVPMPTASLEERISDVETALVELAGIIVGGV